MNNQNNPLKDINVPQSENNPQDNSPDINKKAYTELIQNEIKFLLAHIRPDALELSHIIAVLKASIQYHYPQEVPQVKSVEESKVIRAYSLFHVLWGDSKEKIYSKQLWGELQCILSEIISVKPFKINADHKNADQSRIEELEYKLTSLQVKHSLLEAENAKYREALTDLVNLKAHKEICGKDDHYTKWQPKVWKQAEQALKPKGDG